MVSGPHTVEAAAHLCRCHPRDLCYVPLAAKREGPGKIRTVNDGTAGRAVRQTDEWIEVEGGRWLPKEFLKPAPPVRAIDMLTTSDVCHAFIKPMTTPAGWADEAQLPHAPQRPSLQHP